MKKGKSKVLLVEDEKTLAMIIKDTLEYEGFDVICAMNGVEGLKLYYTDSPDVIIADIMMPEMDGFEIVKQIRKDNQAIPILFLTARSSIEDLVHGFNLGGNDYLKKPFKMLELVVRALHVFICKLRKKLSCDERIRIINIRGIGYKLILKQE